MLFDIIFVNYLLMSFLIFVINMKSLAIFGSLAVIYQVYPEYEPVQNHLTEG